MLRSSYPPGNFPPNFQASTAVKNVGPRPPYGSFMPSASPLSPDTLVAVLTKVYVIDRYSLCSVLKSISVFLVNSHQLVLTLQNIHMMMKM